MKIWVLVVIILIAFAIGYYGYKFIPYKFTPNIPPIFEFINEELVALNNKLQQEGLSEKEKEEIINRQEEIYNLLKEFFGKDIRLAN